MCANHQKLVMASKIVVAPRSAKSRSRSQGPVAVVSAAGVGAQPVLFSQGMVPVNYEVGLEEPVMMVAEVVLGGKKKPTGFQLKADMFTSYIPTVLKCIDPEFTASAKTVFVLNEMMKNLLGRLTAEAARIASGGAPTKPSGKQPKRKITELHVASAVKNIMRGKLIANAIKEGENAILCSVHCCRADFKTRSQKSQLVFPVPRVHTFMKNNTSNHQIGEHAPIVMTAVLEYVCADMLTSIVCSMKSAGTERKLNHGYVDSILRSSDEELRYLFRDQKILSMSS